VLNRDQAQQQVSGPSSNRLAVRYVFFFLLVAFSILTGLLAAGSLRWRMMQDAPILHYGAFLMEEHGMVPYRDFFDTALPGSFLLHYLIILIGGPGESHFRWVDVIILGLLCFAIFRVMRRFGFVSAWVGFISFAYVYLAFGPAVSLQRDYLGALLVTASLCLVPRESECRQGMKPRYAMIALIFSYAALIKPQFLMGAPVVFLLAFSMDARRSWTWFFKMVGLAAVFFLLPVVLVCGWLWHQDALDEFLFLILEYVPLYQGQTGAHVFIPADEWWPYLLRNSLEMYGLKPLFFLALAGCAAGLWRGRIVRSRVLALISLFLLFSLYPVISGKFWDYHYLPFCLFACLAAAMIFYDQPEAPVPPGPGRLFALVVFLGMLLWAVPASGAVRYVHEAWRFAAPPVSRNVERADFIAAWLDGHTAPEARIQTMSWVDSGVHGLLLSRSRVATRFMLDFHFYHHVDSPPIRQIRAEYIAALNAAPPDYFVIIPNRKRVRGTGTSDRFPELHAFVKNNYQPAISLPDLEIYRYEPHAGTP